MIEYQKTASFSYVHSFNSLSPRYGVVTAIVDLAPSGASDTLVCATSFFMPAKEQEILNQQISDLPFTEDFRSFSQKLGVKTIGEMVNIPVAELIRSDGFTYHALQELLKYLKENHMGHLIKQ